MTLWGEVGLAVLSGYVGAAASRALAAPAQIRRHDRRIRDRDASLRVWVQDEDNRLAEEMKRTTEEMNRDGLLYSGTLLNALATAKELVLHRWGDDSEGAKRDVVAMMDEESFFHALLRDMWKPAPTLTALKDPSVLAFVAKWEEDVEPPGGGTPWPVKKPPPEVRRPGRQREVLPRA